RGRRDPAEILGSREEREDLIDRAGDQLARLQAVGGHGSDLRCSVDGAPAQPPGRSVPLKTCQARADLATRLMTMYVFSATRSSRQRPILPYWRTIVTANTLNEM